MCHHHTWLTGAAGSYLRFRNEKDTLFLCLSLSPVLLPATNEINSSSNSVGAAEVAGLNSVESIDSSPSEILPWVFLAQESTSSSSSSFSPACQSLDWPRWEARGNLYLFRCGPGPSPVSPDAD